MQRERRRDPYPWTWEIPLLVIVGTLFILVIGIQLGRSLANLLAGAGWTWPDTTTGTFPSPIGSAFWASLPGVITGHADAGLPASHPDALAGPGLVWVSLALTETALLGATVWFGAYAYQRWGNGRMRGMASASEAEKILGITRLRKVGGIVRPDLYGKHANPPAPVHRQAGDPEPASAQLGRGLTNPLSANPWLHPGRTNSEHDLGGHR